MCPIDKDDIDVRLTFWGGVVLFVAFLMALLWWWIRG